MKPPTIKKLCAFIIMIMFSYVIVNAQCPGDKVLIHHVVRHCTTMCVHPSEFKKYHAQGWQIGPCTCCGYVQNNNKIENKKMMVDSLTKNSPDKDVAFQHSYFCRCNYRDYGCTGANKKACIAYCGPRCGHVGSIQKISLKNTSPDIVFQSNFIPITIPKSEDNSTKLFESKRSFIRLPVNSKDQLIYEMEWHALDVNTLNSICN